MDTEGATVTAFTWHRQVPASSLTLRVALSRSLPLPWASVFSSENGSDLGTPNLIPSFLQGALGRGMAEGKSGGDSGPWALRRGLGDSGVKFWLCHFLASDLGPLFLPWKLK